MKVLKFGGSSVATPERLRAVARIIHDAAKRNRVIVVVSAFQGVTNQLLEAGRRAEAGDRTYKRIHRSIAQRHLDAVAEIGNKRGLRVSISSMLEELAQVLRGVELLRHASPRTLDIIASFGERLSAPILAAFLQRHRSADAMDARALIVTDDRFTHATVLFEQTEANIRARFPGRSRRGTPVPIVTGFIGATADGLTTTIGRNGSDYTAAIIGAAVGASVVEIWTDVDGVMSADPRAVRKAFVLPHITYEEAMELSYFGATVLHSASIAPAVARGIPILIKNTFNPEGSGTRVSRAALPREGVAKGITSVDGITLLTLRGLSMVGVPGTAERLFRALATRNVNVILISQASSEHTICFAVRSADTDRARQALADEFRFEFHSRLTRLDEKPSQTIVAIVGEGMKGTPGVSGKVFQALGINHINISAIAQGASERNISFVIDSAAKTRALNVIHEAFFETRKKLGLMVVGVGTIGSALLSQLAQQRQTLLAQGFDVRVVGVANSKQYHLDSEGINLAHWNEQLQRSTRRMDPETLVHELAALDLTNAALVDCTASADIVAAYAQFVKTNMHIITPNKRANVLAWRQYNALMQLMRERQKLFFFEANVGAGLPIISTLQDLIASGDVILRIEGILSGTLSYLFNAYDGSRPFSAMVKKAHRMGFTEPDPRDDLSGEDVARKLLILGRQLGWKMDLGDVRCQNLVPPALRRGTAGKDFYSRLAQIDRPIHDRYEKAKRRGHVIRYVGTLENQRGSAGLQEFPRDHPFAATKGSDNVIVFTTKRYARTPLVVQGPGAGADVTAMGVFSDILKLLHYLPY